MLGVIVMYYCNIWTVVIDVIPASPLFNLTPTWGSSQRAMVFPTSWIKPTNWNQSAEQQWIQISATLMDVLVHSLCGYFLSLSLLWYLCLGVLGGCPQQSGRRGRSWGSPHPGRTRPPAGLETWWRPSSPSGCGCSRTSQSAAGR